LPLLLNKLLKLPSNIWSKTYFAPLCILIIATLGYLFDQQLNDMFIYDRALITQGEYWRLITGHLLHTNLAHFLLNSAAVILLAILHGKFYTISNYFFVFIISALFTSIGIYFYDPKLIYYVGLSGILHGIFIWGALKDIVNKDKTGYLLFIGVIMKITHEQIYGASDDIAKIINANVAIDAHLWGTVSGILAFSILLLLNSRIFTNKIK